MPGASMNTDASIKYWNEMWLDELIDETFRLIQKKKTSHEVSDHRGHASTAEVHPSILKK